VARLGLTDIAERRHLAEVGNHLAISGPGAILVVERLVERANFHFRQIAHVEPPKPKKAMVPIPVNSSTSGHKEESPVAHRFAGDRVDLTLHPGGEVPTARVRR
jgi:hypothetical protein